MSTLAVNTITNAAGGNTAQINGMTPTAQSLQGFRNRIINGDMRINQRAATATINSSSYTYAVDRWAGIGQAADGVFTLQSSTVAPTGFQNSLLATVTTADASLAAGQFYAVRQAIEGFNFADLSWGTASASAVTLSFWVRSSLTGTFGGSIRNSASNRSYPFTYAISAANTWEQKTITVAGDTTGTWETGSSTGADVFFGLGVGSTFSGTAGAWAGSNFLSATGAVSVVGTSGATFYITGVQLEAGSVATPFERRPFGTELALCQRYYEVGYNARRGGASAFTAGSDGFSVSKRASPTMASFGTVVGTGLSFSAAPNTPTEAFGFSATANGEGYVQFNWSSSSEI
jgi:hypothetical protein